MMALPKDLLINCILPYLYGRKELCLILRTCNFYSCHEGKFKGKQSSTQDEYRQILNIVYEKKLSDEEYDDFVEWVELSWHTKCMLWIYPGECSDDCVGNCSVPHSFSFQDLLLNAVTHNRIRIIQLLAGKVKFPKTIHYSKVYALQTLPNGTDQRKEFAEYWTLASVAAVLGHPKVLDFLLSERFHSEIEKKQILKAAILDDKGNCLKLLFKNFDISVDFLERLEDFADVWYQSENARLIADEMRRRYPEHQRNEW